MTAVVDISCPDCEAIRAVRKVGVGQYRCEECGAEFSAEEVLSRIGSDGSRPPNVDD